MQSNSSVSSQFPNEADCQLSYQLHKDVALVAFRGLYVFIASVAAVVNAAFSWLLVRKEAYQRNVRLVICGMAIATAQYFVSGALVECFNLYRMATIQARFALHYVHQEIDGSFFD